MVSAFQADNISQVHSFNMNALSAGVYEVKVMAGNTVWKVLRVTR